MALVTGDAWPVGRRFAGSAAGIGLKHAADLCRFPVSLTFQSTFSTLPVVRISSRQRPLTGLGTNQGTFQSGKIQ
jgi:hypothetical protein